MTTDKKIAPLNRRWENMADKLSAISRPVMDAGEITARDKVFEAVKHYYSERKATQIIKPGFDPIPASSKLLDESDLLSLVDGCLDMWLTEGRFADEFQRRLGKRLGSKPAKLTVSGSAANLLAFSSLLSPSLPNHLKSGDEVITVAAGFPTTVFPILQNGCIPVFIDIELGTYNVNVDLLKSALTKKTKAVMLAHTMGNPFNLDVVKKFCNEHGLFLIEDC
jgi:CDP-6-deoxy-D-xylo-4-hexulose-3-dehydrase